VEKPIMGASTEDVEAPEENLTPFNRVERELRKKTFGILSTVDRKGRPHSTGLIFAVSSPEDSFAIYMVTLGKSAKVRYIKNNPNVSLLVTFPHYYLRFIPDSTIMFRGTADLTTLDDEEAQRAFAQKKMTRMNLEMDSDVLKSSVVIRIRPNSTVYCYGVGIGLNQLRKDPTAARYKVVIPKERFEGDEK